MDIMGALRAFGKGITEGTGKDIKGLSNEELKDYKSFLDTLTAQQRKAEQSKLRGMNQVTRNRFVRGRIKDFGSAATKEVERQGGQNKEGALAKGGSVRRKMSMGGKAHRGRRAQGNKA